MGAQVGNERSSLYGDTLQKKRHLRTILSLEVHRLHKGGYARCLMDLERLSHTQDHRDEVSYHAAKVSEILGC